MKFELSEKEIKKANRFKDYHLNIIQRRDSNFQYIFEEKTSDGFVFGGRVWIKETVSGDISEITDYDSW